MIDSILDVDLYKLTMQQAVLKLYPRAVAKYRFVNRSKDQRFSPEMVEVIGGAVRKAGRVALKIDEEAWLRTACPYFYPWYVDWLRGFRLNPDFVKIDYDQPTMQLVVTIEGPWCETIYWEVPLLAIITEQLMRAQQPNPNMNQVEESALQKARELSKEECRISEFGTRRRFSYEVQDAVLRKLIEGMGPYLNGTSNVHLANKYRIKPIGTMAHEWIQAISGLVGLRYANRYAMEAWNSVYEGRLGIALTDTYGIDAFFGDFNGVYARLFDGLRQDSGDPALFIERAIEHYHKLGIDPASRAVILSDSLNVSKCVYYQRAYGDKVKLSFGVGTSLTNDVPGTMPANVVIKMVAIDGIPVVKLSEDPSKAVGDPKAIEVAKWTFGC